MKDAGVEDKSGQIPESYYRYLIKHLILVYKNGVMKRAQE